MLTMPCGCETKGETLIRCGQCRAAHEEANRLNAQMLREKLRTIARDQLERVHRKESA